MQWAVHSQIPKMTKTPVLRALAPDSAEIKPNPFDDLPIDIAMMIASYLSTREVLFLSLASPATSHKLDLAEFWKYKVRRDMPWFWELDVEKVEDLVNWRGAYFDLRDRAIWGSGNMQLGLVNRKRIWKICEGLAERYLERRAELRLLEVSSESEE